MVKDLSGKRFGKLVAVEALKERSKRGSVYWRCICDCGNETIVCSDNLRLNGGTQSCGCRSDEARRKNAYAIHEKAVERKQAKEAARAERKENAFGERFDERFGTRFKYISGYPNDNIKIVCKRCGTEKDVKRKWIFESGRNIACVSCDDKGHDFACTECGAIFTQYSPQQILCRECHEEEGRAKRNAQKRIREARMTINGKVDYSITLAKLIDRDKHICKLCGREVNESDYVYIGDVFIAGNDYPSIDHIKPLSKGGVHQWDNVQLAHRLCNSIKRAKEI